jgi:cell division protein FtsX
MVALRHGLRRSIRQLSRDSSWGTTLLLLTALMVLVQLFLMFLLGVHGVGRMLTERAGIQLEVQETASEQDIQELYAALRANAAVQSVAYVPKDQAYARQRARDPELINFLEQYKLDNPFPDTFSVTLKSLDSYDIFLREVQQARWSSVVSSTFLSSVTSREQEIRTLLQVTNGLRTLSIFFAVIAFVLLFCVIVEWVSQAAVNRGHELLLEHMLGAPPLAVLLPFAAQVTFLLIGGAIIGTVVVFALFSALPLLMPALALELPFQQLLTEMRPLIASVFPLIILIEIIAMPLLALVGTVLGVRAKLPASFTLFQ